MSKKTKNDEILTKLWIDVEKYFGDHHEKLRKVLSKQAEIEEIDGFIYDAVKVISLEAASHKRRYPLINLDTEGCVSIMIDAIAEVVPSLNNAEGVKTYAEETRCVIWGYIKKYKHIIPSFEARLKRDNKNTVVLKEFESMIRLFITIVYV